jgi:hypothetical protein
LLYFHICWPVPFWSIQSWKCHMGFSLGNKPATQLHALLSHRYTVTSHQETERNDVAGYWSWYDLPIIQAKELVPHVITHS